MSRTYRRKTWLNWEERGNKRFREKIKRRGDCTHRPQCCLCGNNDVLQRAEKRGKNQRAMIQEMRDSE